MKRTEEQKATLEAFRNGPTHAAKKSVYEVKDRKSLIQSIVGINLQLFGAYLEAEHIKEDDFEQQRFRAKAYSDVILGMLKDFIDSCERGELDEPV